MSNQWGIPKWLEEEVRARDKFCVYCGVQLVGFVLRGKSRKAMTTWEHIVNDAKIITRDNVALCCAACNSSKGTKPLVDWLNSDYCKKKNINQKTVASIIKKALKS